MKFRFRFSRWFLRLVHVRFTEQLSTPVVVALFTVAMAELSAAAADAAAVVLLQQLHLAVHVVVVAVATSFPI